MSDNKPDIIRVNYYAAPKLPAENPLDDFDPFSDPPAIDEEETRPGDLFRGIGVKSLINDKSPDTNHKTEQALKAGKLTWRNDSFLK